MIIKHTYTQNGTTVTDELIAVSKYKVIQCLHDLLTIAIIGAFFFLLFWGMILTEVSL